MRQELAGSRLVPDKFMRYHDIPIIEPFYLSVVQPCLPAISALDSRQRFCHVMKISHDFFGSYC